MGAARQLLAAGAGSVEAAVVHALYDDQVAKALAEAGISRVISSDSVIHPTNQVRLAPLLAAALQGGGVRNHHIFPSSSGLVRGPNDPPARGSR